MRSKTFFLVCLTILCSYLILRWIPIPSSPRKAKPDCQNAGLLLLNSADARSSGFFDSRPTSRIEERVERPPQPFWQNVEAIASGRIKFFELQQAGGGYYFPTRQERQIAVLPLEFRRFYLDDFNSDKCLVLNSLFNWRAKMMRLAPGKCVAAEQTDILLSAYLLSERKGLQNSRITSLSERHGKEFIACYTSVEERKEPYKVSPSSNGSKSQSTSQVPSVSAQSIGHDHFISLVLKDEAGNVDSISSLLRMEKMIQEAPRKLDDIDVAQLELHRVYAEDGFEPTDPGSKWREAEVLVSLDKPMLLLLESEAHLRWHIMAARNVTAPIVIATRSKDKSFSSLAFSVGDAGNVRHIFWVPENFRGITENTRKTIEEKLSSKPVTEQKFGTARFVSIDGVARSVRSEQAKPMWDSRLLNIY